VAFSAEDLHALRLAWTVFFDEGNCGFVDQVVLEARVSLLYPSLSKVDVEGKVALFLEETEDAAADGPGGLSFVKFLRTMHRARVLGQGSHFSHLVDQVEAKLMEVPGAGVVNAFLLLTFFVLLSASTTIFRFFVCRDFPDAPGGQESYLVEDYSIDCNKPRHSFFAAYAGVMILVYPVGIPAMYAVMLYKKRRTLSNATAMNREKGTGFPTTGHLKFLVEAYKPSYYWFEAFECMRRLILGCVIGLADPDSAAAAVMGIVFSFIFYSVFIGLMPFKKQDENTFSITLSASLGFLFLAALMIKVDITSDGDDDQDLFSALLVLILFAGPVVVTIQAAWRNIPAALGILSLVFGKKTEEKSWQKAEAKVSNDQDGEGDQGGESKDDPAMKPSRFLNRSPVGSSLDA